MYDFHLRKLRKAGAAYAAYKYPGATLGYLHGNVPGAVLGDFVQKKVMYTKWPETPTPKSRVRKKSYAESPAVPGYSGTGPWQGIPYSLPKKNMQVDKPGKFNPMYGGGGVNQLAGRASMRMQTKKLKSKRVRKVQVPKKLRKQIKQIMIGKNLTGKYVTSRIGCVGVASPAAANQPADITLYGVNTKPAYFYTNNGPSTYGFSSWFCPTWQGNTAPSLDVSSATQFKNFDALTFFHPAKFMDAASVLWHNKQIEEKGWTTQTGNIQNRITTAGAEGNQNRVSNVSFQIVNSFVEFEIKNVSQRSMTLRILTCEPKHKILSQYPLSTIVTGVGEDVVENGALYAVSSGVDPNNPLFNFRDSPYFAGQYKYDVMEVIVKGGETCKHSLQGPKNVEFNTAKFLVNTLNGEQYNMKGTKNVIIQVLPDAQITTSGIPGNYMEYSGAPSNNYKCPLIVTRIETIILKVPETAGFIKNDNVDGDIQTLNQKRNVTAYGNFANQAWGNTAYFGVDEENVAAGIMANGLYF